MPDQFRYRFLQRLLDGRQVSGYFDIHQFGNFLNSIKTVHLKEGNDVSIFAIIISTRTIARPDQSIMHPAEIITIEKILEILNEVLAGEDPIYEIEFHSIVPQGFPA